ncbi:MAG: hypothetical protein ACUVSL_01410 [Chloroflexus sp.]|uniref:hypothetical protein n=1 Tax=Chloroflexus sp. TaxID=1904827 RepID=UPI00404920A2
MRTGFLLSLVFCLLLAPLTTLYAAPGPQPELPLPAGDVLIAPPPATLSFAVGDDQRSPHLPSQYLAGRVAVQLILPESTGAIDPSTEDWHTEQINQIVGEAQAALDWWRERLPAARLEFDLSVQVVPTRYEPIRYGLAQEGRWIGDVLAELGYISANYFEQAYMALFDLREQRGTDWATIFFIANSANDDGYFADGRFAYAYLNGPFSVITSDGGPYQTHWLRSVIAHEFAHLFGALDQYGVAGVSCDQRSGYLFTPTTNSMFNNCGTNEPSIMRELINSFITGAVDTSARHQLGYRDSDDDGVIDVLDTTPVLSMTVNIQAVSQRPVVELTARDLPYPSPVQPDASINQITAIEYRVGDGEWQLVLPTDGSFDSRRETAQIELPLYDGTYEVEFRAFNTAGNAATPITQTFTVSGLGPMPDYHIPAPAQFDDTTLMIQLQAPADTHAVELSIGRDFRSAIRLPYQPALMLPLSNELSLMAVKTTTTTTPVMYVRFVDSAGRLSLAYTLPIEIPSPSYHQVMVPLILR